MHRPSCTTLPVPAQCIEFWLSKSRFELSVPAICIRRSGYTTGCTISEKTSTENVTEQSYLYEIRGKRGPKEGWWLIEYNVEETDYRKLHSGTFRFYFQTCLLKCIVSMFGIVAASVIVNTVNPIVCIACEPAFRAWFYLGQNRSRFCHVHAYGGDGSEIGCSRLLLRSIYSLRYPHLSLSACYNRKNLLSDYFALHCCAAHWRTRSLRHIKRNAVPLPDRLWLCAYEYDKWIRKC